MNERRLASAANMAVRQRNYRRARDRALVQLAQLYPDTYTELLEREKANDEAQGRKWIDIDGNTNGVGTRPTSTPALAGQAGNQGENEGNNGGEA
jgi:hypothetical protein